MLTRLQQAQEQERGPQQEQERGPQQEQERALQQEQEREQMAIWARFFRRMEVSPRPAPTSWQVAGGTGAAVAAALTLGAVLLAALGVNPWDALGAMFSASFFGGAFALNDTLVKATPLILCGLGCTIAFKARLWNVGAEGQLLLGAWAAAGVATFGLSPQTPSALLLLAMGLAAVLAGGLWAGIAGALRAWLGVNEIISSLMLVYVAQKFLNYFVFGAWSQRGFPLTPLFPGAAQLPRLSQWAEAVPALAGLTAHLGIVLALMLALGLGPLLHRTVWGFELRLLGDSPRAARYAGISVPWQRFWIMVASGMLAGLAGMIEVAGVVHRLQEGLSPGYGFVGIAVAWLGRLNPWGILVSGVLFGGLMVGAKEVQPQGIALMLQGTIMLVVVAGDFFLRHTVRWRPVGPRSVRRQAS